MIQIKKYLDQQLGGSKNTLLLTSVGILYAMVAFRMIYSGKLYYLFLIWNTFLAVVPYILSEYTNKRNMAKIKTASLVLLSILFLPNALYLISDFEHLAERPPVPFFFDILLMFYAGILGLFFNILSLRNINSILLRYLKPKITNRLIATIIFLSGFGVYLGRYLRWNSWDIITNPISLFSDCAHRIVQPHLYTYTWAVTIGYAFILGFAYIIFHNSSAFFNQENNDQHA